MESSDKKKIVAIDKQLKCGASLDEKSPDGFSILHEASQIGGGLLLQYLLEKNPNLINAKSEKGTNVLFYAAKSNNEIAVNFFLQHPKGTELALSTNILGLTINYFAASSGNIDLLKKFLKIRNDSLFATNKNKEMLNGVLYQASCYGHLAMVKYLIKEFNADIYWVAPKNSLAIHGAAENGHTAVVEFFISEMKMSPDVSAFPSGSTPLYVAATYGKLDTIKTLVEKFHADPVRRYDHALPIFSAAKHGYTEVVIYFASLNISVNDYPEKAPGLTPLYVASESGHLETVKVLVEKLGANDRLTFNGWLPAHQAAFMGHIQVVQFFLNRKAIKVDEPIKCNPGKGLLHIAAEKGHLPIAKMLVENFKADPLLFDKNGILPSHYAASGGHIKLLEYFLLDLKIDVNLTSKDEHQKTCLHFAAGHKANLDTIKFLIETCRANEKLSTQYGYFPIHLAADSGKIDIVLYLISQRGIDLNLQSVLSRETPLHSAAEAGKLDTVVKLVEMKADLFASQEDDLIPFHTAAAYGHMQVFRYLASKVNINFQSSITQSTALHVAAEYKKPEIAYWLVRDRADLSLENKDGYTALDLARREANTDAVIALYSPTCWFAPKWDEYDGYEDMKPDFESKANNDSEQKRLLRCVLAHDTVPKLAMKLEAQRIRRRDPRTGQLLKSFFSEQSSLAEQQLLKDADVHKEFMKSLKVPAQYLEIDIIENSLFQKDPRYPNTQENLSRSLLVNLALVEKDFFNKLPHQISNYILKFLFFAFLITPPKTLLRAINMKSELDCKEDLGTRVAFYQKLKKVQEHKAAIPNVNDPPKDTGSNKVSKTA